jgi:hypothetical protein
MKLIFEEISKTAKSMFSSPCNDDEADAQDVSKLCAGESHFFPPSNPSRCLFCRYSKESSPDAQRASRTSMLAVITMLVDRGAAETAHAKQMIVLELLEAANPAPPATINAAVDSRTVEILDVLNISGIPFDMCNSTGETVLHLAAKKHLPKVLDRLLSTGMCSTSKLCTAHRPPLYWAILHKSKKMIKAFVTFNPNIIQELEADAQEQIFKSI